MVMSDYIALGILIFCISLGLCGLLKWLLRFIAGAAVGVVILIGLSFLANDPHFNKFSHGVFREGLVFPCMRNHITSLDRFRNDTYEVTENKLTQNDS